MRQLYVKTTLSPPSLSSQFVINMRHRQGPLNSHSIEFHWPLAPELMISSVQIPDAVTAHYLTVAGLPPQGHGPNQTPPRLARLLALATQKFIADVAADAYQYSRIRASNSSSANNPMGGLNAAAGLNMPGATNLANAAGAAAGATGGDVGKGKGGTANTHLGIQRPGFGGGGQGGSGQGRTVLTIEDLGMAVGEYGVSVKRGEFYR
jgi:transcription initiation factor TFIID subunit 10